MAYSFISSNSVYDRSWAYWQDGFTFEEINKIIKLGEKDLTPQKAGVDNGQISGVELDDKRNSYVSWIESKEETNWLFDRLAQQLRNINEKYFGFDLWGFGENLQYTIYDADRGPEHYDWHIDNAGKGKPCRKLSLTLQLSEAMDYEGGELWIHGLRKEVMTKAKGHMIVFPSYVLHRVTPVTKGVRRSLVAWITGPDYR